MNWFEEFVAEVREQRRGPKRFLTNEEIDWILHTSMKSLLESLQKLYPGRSYTYEIKYTTSSYAIPTPHRLDNGKTRFNHSWADISISSNGKPSLEFHVSIWNEEFDVHHNSFGQLYIFGIGNLVPTEEALDDYPVAYEEPLNTICNQYYEDICMFRDQVREGSFRTHARTSLIKDELLSRA
jgi:hypothetical protein